MVNMVNIIPAKHQHDTIVLVSIEHAEASLDYATVNQIPTC